MPQAGRSRGAPKTLPAMENSPRASPRSRQQCRPGAPRLEEENAARRGVSRDEASPQLREALGAAGAGKGRSGAPLSQAAAQTHGARGLLTPPPLMAEAI